MDSSYDYLSPAYRISLKFIYELVEISTILENPVKKYASSPLKQRVAIIYTSANHHRGQKLD
jgi:hypothetical protein